jgi:hypothetical protein
MAKAILWISWLGSNTWIRTRPEMMAIRLMAEACFKTRCLDFVMKPSKACQRGIHLGNVDSIEDKRNPLAEVVRNKYWRNWEKFGQSNKKFGIDSSEWPHARRRRQRNQSDADGSWERNVRTVAGTSLHLSDGARARQQRKLRGKTVL